MNFAPWPHWPPTDVGCWYQHNEIMKYERVVVNALKEFFSGNLPVLAPYLQVIDYQSLHSTLGNAEPPPQLPRVPASLLSFSFGERTVRMNSCRAR
jgi:hypothetical protein